jgi:hypothetical protein
MEGRCETHALQADTIDVRRLHEGMAADAELVEAQIVDQDDQDIRFAPVCHSASPAARRAPKHTPDSLVGPVQENLIR